MRIFLNICYVFMLGASIGWVIEVFFRRFFSAKKWMNPGFLKGPYLPLYGFGLLYLFLISNYLDLHISSVFWNDFLIVIFIGIGMTLLEYIAGMIFIKGLNIKLWDYSGIRGNYKGIICPLFSTMWVLAGAVYYFLLNGIFVRALDFFNNYVFYMEFWIGIVYGVFLIDLVVSTNAAAKLAKAARSSKFVVSYEQYKLSRMRLRKYRENEFLSDNPRVADFIEASKARSAELIGKIVYKDESSHNIHLRKLAAKQLKKSALVSKTGKATAKK